MPDVMFPVVVQLELRSSPLRRLLHDDLWKASVTIARAKVHESNPKRRRSGLASPRRAAPGLDGPVGPLTCPTPLMETLLESVDAVRGQATHRTHS